MDAGGDTIELIVDLERDVYEAFELMADRTGTTAERLAAEWIRGVISEIVRAKIEREENP